MTWEQKIEYKNWQKENQERDYQVLIDALNSLAAIDLILKDESNTDRVKNQKIRFETLLFQGKSNIDF